MVRASLNESFDSDQGEDDGWTTYHRSRSHERNLSVNNTYDTWIEGDSSSFPKCTNFSVPPTVWKCLRDKAEGFSGYDMSSSLREQILSNDIKDTIANARLMYQTSIIQLYHRKAFLLYRTRSLSPKFICCYSGIYSNSEGPLFLFLTRTTNIKESAYKTFPWCLSAVLSIGDIALYTRAPELKVKYSWSKFIDCDLPSVQLLESIFKKTEVTEISLAKWDSDRNVIMKKENPHVWDRKHRLDSGRIDSKSLHTEIAPHRVQPFIFKDKNAKDIQHQFLEQILDEEGNVDGYYVLKEIKEGVFVRTTILSKIQAERNLSLTRFMSSVLVDPKDDMTTLQTKHRHSL